ncbi:hypothetical protein GH714_012075 [Hevea brasiliensis]|uniref:Uncharacterized protein n=1 Tax=Hevea brasiliensis TaxID=3981 RepID=A0A6A6M9Q0_HEVBR|nr:hypothetical protein GH714_012075 [Hevea brasiliensis]
MAIAMVAKSATCEAIIATPNRTDTVVGDSINEEEEVMMDSEANRRILAVRKPRYISYAAMKANMVPCDQRAHLTTIAILKRRLTLTSEVAKVLQHFKNNSNFSRMLLATPSE